MVVLLFIALYVALLFLSTVLFQAVYNLAIPAMIPDAPEINFWAAFGAVLLLTMVGSAFKAARRSRSE